MWAVASLSYGVDVINNTQEGRARFSGLQTCGSVWACPCCSGTVSEQRRRELNALLAWARKQGLHPVMLTLTARHSVDHRLAELLDGMKNAKRRLTTHRTFAKLLRPQLVGYVTATEVTGGGFNGWHPHFHQVMLVRAGSQAEALDLVEKLREPWLASLRAEGLDGSGPRSGAGRNRCGQLRWQMGRRRRACPVGQEVGPRGAQPFPVAGRLRRPERRQGGSPVCGVRWRVQGSPPTGVVARLEEAGGHRW